jgi:protein phosphatase
MPAPAMSISFGACTDVGARRELNEDAVLAASPIFAVADGMGGHAAGEIAATLAVQKMSVLKGRTNLRRDDLASAIGAANAAILEYERGVSETRGMGTTICGVCLGEVAGSPHWFVFNVGDSRVYRFADGTFTQLTIDHSEVAELVAAGQITADEALIHPLRNVVTRSLGVLPPPAADIWVLPVQPKERFLICSDGLPLEVSETVMAAQLSGDSTPQSVAETLVSCAVSAGGRDNVSAVVVDVSYHDNLVEADEATVPRKRFGER